MIKVICSIAAIIPLSFARPNVQSKTLYIVHIIPRDSANYTVTSELKTFRLSTMQAIQDFTKEHPKCEIAKVIKVDAGSEAQLFDYVEAISKNPGKKVAIGFSRSGLARIAAKASAGTDTAGISVGASTDELSRINHNFFSMAAPWQGQWKAILVDMTQRSCAPDKTLIISDIRDSYSATFVRQAASSNYRNTIDLNTPDIKTTILQRLATYECVFMAMNMSTSHALLSRLFATGWKGTIYGTGDWLYYSGELDRIEGHERFGKDIRILSPTGWVGQPRPESRKRLARLRARLGEPPNANAVYSYDAAILALTSLCHETTIGSLLKNKLKELEFIKSYSGVSQTGNLLSPLHMVNYRAR